MLKASLPNNYSIASTSFCITAAVADANRSAQAIAALDPFLLGPGYMDNSAVDASASDRGHTKRAFPFQPNGWHVN